MRRHALIPLALMFSVAVAACDTDQDEMGEEATPAGEQPAQVEQPTAEMGGDEAADAREDFRDARSILQEMRSDPDLSQALDQAQGVLIVPQYGRAGAVVGASGGEGVLLTRQNGEWGQPAFYDLGGISVGAEFGAEGGDIALILMSEGALNSFESSNTFSLDAQSGLTILDYSGASKGTIGTGDVVMWSDLEGAFAGATLGANEISFDEEETAAYYGQQVTPGDIMSGNVMAPAGGGMSDQPGMDDESSEDSEGEGY